MNRYCTAFVLFIVISTTLAAQTFRPLSATRLQLNASGTTTGSLTLVASSGAGYTLTFPSGAPSAGAILSFASTNGTMSFAAPLDLYQATNGLTESGTNTFKLGGALTEPTSIIVSGGNTLSIGATNGGVSFVIDGTTGQATILGPISINATGTQATVIGNSNSTTTISTQNMTVSGGPINLNTGNSTDPINIGGSGSTSTFLGTININATGSGTTTIGNSGSTVTIGTLATALNSGTGAYDRVLIANSDGRLEQASFAAIVAAGGGGNGWTTTGNAITSSSGTLGSAPTGQWFGTSNANDLRFATNGLTRMIIASDGSVSTQRDAVVNSVTVGRGGNNVATNLAIGASALAANTSGSGNVAVGSEALQANNDGSFNTASGYQTLSANVSGWSNTAVGQGALKANVSGNNNTSAGFRSLYLNEASSNTAFGLEALHLNVTGSSNVAIGNQAGYNETGSNKLYIANSSANNLIYGDFSQGLVSINAGSTPAAPGAALQVNVLAAGTKGFIVKSAASQTGNLLELQNSSGDVLLNINPNGAITLAAFGASAGNTNEMRFQELSANGSNYVGFKAADNITTNRIWTLPSADGTSGQVLSTDGSGSLSWATGLTGASGWAIAGNSITNPSTQFLGTTSAQPLVIRTNNTEKLRVASDGNVGIGDSSPAALLTVGSGDAFQVNSSGAIAAVTGITTSGGYTQSGTGANTITGGTTITNTLDVTGATSINTTGAASTSIGTSGATNTILGATSINNTGDAVTNIGTGSAAGTVTIGRTSGTLTTIGSLGHTGAATLTGTTNVNTTGSATTTIGNASATNAIAGVTSITGTTSINTTGSSGTTIGNASSTTAVTGVVNINTTGNGNTTIGNATTTGTTTIATNSTSGRLVISGLPTGTTEDVVLINGSSQVSRRSQANFIAGTGWALAGNSITNPSTQFLGTTNAQPLVIRTNNTEKLRVASDGNVGIGDNSPAALLTVGSGDAFQVNSSGAIAAVTGITTSGGYTQSGTGANTITGGTTITNTLVVTGTTSINTTGAASTSIGTSGATNTILGVTSINNSGNAATNIGTGASAGTVTIGHTGGTLTTLGSLGHTGSATISGGAVSINNNSNNNTSINTGTSTGVVAIGGASSTTNILGTANINTTGTANTAIGNGTGTFALTSPGLNVATTGNISDGNSDVVIADNLDVTGTGTNTYVTLTNSASGTGATDGLEVGLLSDLSTRIWNYESAPLVIGTSGTEILRIASDGNVVFTTPALPSTSSFSVVLANTNNKAMQLRFREPDASGDEYSSFQADPQAYDLRYTLPTIVPTLGQGLTVASVLGTSDGGVPVAYDITLEWAPVIGNSGSGPVTGSGVDGRLAWWNSATNVTSDANLFWDDANNRLGIGTETPGASLDVEGNILISNGNTDARELRFAEPNYQVAIGNTQTTAFIAQAQTDNLTYTLPASGPASSVYGSNHLALASTGAGSSVTLEWQTFWSPRGNAGTTQGTSFLGTTDNQGLAFRTNNSERLRITSDGIIDLAAGTTIRKSGAIGDPGVPSVFLEQGTLNANSWIFREGTSGQLDYGFYHYNSDVVASSAARNSFMFTNSSSDGIATGWTASTFPSLPSGVRAAVILNQITGSGYFAGKLGVNTIDPKGRLHLVMNAASDTGLVVSAHASQTSDLMSIRNSGGTALVSVNSAGLLTAGVGAQISGGSVSINASSNNATNINTGTSTGAVTLGNTGSSVTIGSVATSLKSSTGSNDRFVIANSSGQLDQASFSAVVGANAWSRSGNTITEGVDFLGTTTGRYLEIRTNNTERIRITSSGNVGIGDASPAALLTVGSGDAFQVNSSGAIAAVTGITTSGGYTQSGTGANTFTGATTITNTLGVTGATNINVTGTAATSIGNTGAAVTIGRLATTLNTNVPVAADRIVLATSNGALEQASITAVIGASGWSLMGNDPVEGTNYLGTSTNKYLDIRTNNVERMRVTADGNVGIGTTTASHQLTVAGNATTSTLLGPLYVAGKTDATNNGVALTLDATNDGGTIYSMVAGGSATDIPGGFGIYQSGTAYRMAINSDGEMHVGSLSNTTDHLNFGSTLNVRGNASIGSNYWDDAAPANGLLVEGNVGIGTTGPVSSKLTVVNSTDGNKGLVVAASAGQTANILEVQNSGGTALVSVGSSGALTATVGATISGATTSINDNSNFNTNINTGTSTGAVNIGTGSASGAVTLGRSDGTSTITGTTSINADVNNATNINTGTSTGAVNIGSTNTTITISGPTNINTVGTSAATVIGSTDATVSILGGVKVSVYVNAAGPYTVGNEAVVIQKGTGDVTLPAVGETGRLVVVRNANGTAAAVNVTAGAFTTNVPDGESRTFVSDGTDWYVIGN
ncbi:MAG: hypothetical protein ACK475_11190 [Bacteroidota bacterium]